MKRRVALSLAVGLLAVSSASIDRARGGSRAHTVAAHARLPLSFEANQGQTDPRVRFLARGIGHTVFLTPQEVVVSTSPTVLRMSFVAANPQARVAGLEPLPGKANYFIGRDRTRWHAHVPMFAQVRYHDVYPGIDLTFSGDQRHLDFAFVVNPGADPNRIVIGGQSRGGILSVAYAGQHPEQVKGVINFVGGWLGYGCKTVSTVNQEIFKRGAHYPSDTIWLYGDWDFFYPLFHSRENFTAFQAAGGKGVFHEFAPPPGLGGHGIVARPDLWTSVLDDYLKRRGLANDER